VDVHYHVFVRDLITQSVSELKETHAMRYFFKPELSMITAQNDLQLQNVEEWVTGKNIGTDTWGVCFCLKAI